MNTMHHDSPSGQEPLPEPSFALKAQQGAGKPHRAARPNQLRGPTRPVRAGLPSHQWGSPDEAPAGGGGSVRSAAQPASIPCDLAPPGTLHSGARRVSHTCSALRPMATHNQAPGQKAKSHPPDTRCRGPAVPARNAPRQATPAPLRLLASSSGGSQDLGTSTPAAGQRAGVHGATPTSAPARYRSIPLQFNGASAHELQVPRLSGWQLALPDLARAPRAAEAAGQGAHSQAPLAGSWDSREKFQPATKGVFAGPGVQRARQSSVSSPITATHTPPGAGGP